MYENPFRGLAGSNFVYEIRSAGWREAIRCTKIVPRVGGEQFGVRKFVPRVGGNRKNSSRGYFRDVILVKFFGTRVIAEAQILQKNGA